MSTYLEQQQFIGLGETQEEQAEIYRPALREGVELADVDGLGWILHNRKDGKYSRVSEVGQKLVTMIDGRHSLEELRQRLQNEMERPVSVDTVERFITSLGEQGMLADRDAKPAKKKRPVQKLMHLRFPFFQGEKIVGFVTRMVQSVPKPIGYPLLVALVMWGATAPVYLASKGLVQWDLHLRQLSWSMIAILVPLMFLEMVLHELAHGVALTICGGKVREFGIGSHYIVVPYSYTNTSDSYRLGRKERIFVSLAGLLVEFALLGVNAVLYLTLPPDSPVRTYALLMMAFELSAVIWNSNPLLPFDGYLVLSDALKEPTLRKRGFSYVRSLLKRVFLFWRPATKAPYTRRQKFYYALYGTLAVLYIVFLLSYGFIVAAMADPRLRDEMFRKHPSMERILRK